MLEDQPTQEQSGSQANLPVENPQRRELIKKIAKAAIAIPAAVVIFEGSTHSLLSY